MRRTTLSAFVLSVCLAAVPATAGVNYWSPIGPEGGKVTILTAAPSISRILYAGTTGGVFRSTDGGAHWLRTSRGLPSNHVVALAVAPSNSSILYASTGVVLLVSRNGGDSWSLIPGQLGAAYTPSLAVDPRNPRWVWAGTQFGLFWSHDGGTRWHSASANFMGRIMDIAIDPVHPDTLYVASVAEQDFGETGIAKTTDGGKTWKRRNRGLDGADIELSSDDVRPQLTVDPTSPNTIYGCFFQFSGDPEEETPLVTYRSTDGAATWKATEGGFPLAVNRQGVVYAGNRRSTDHGASWQPIATPPDFLLRYLAGGSTLWAGTYFSGVFRSDDGAATWHPSASGLHATTVTSLAIHPGQPGVLYAATLGLGVRKTVDAGLSWQPADAGLPADAFLPIDSNPALALDPRQPETVYLAWWQDSTQGLARSDDGGAHWTLLPSDFHQPPSLAVDPMGGLYLYPTGSSDDFCGVARSDDRGLTRRCLLASTGRLILDPVTPGTLWLLDGLNLQKSTDRGDHWTPIQPQGLDHAGVPRSLLIDPVHPGVLYMGTERAFSSDLPQRIWRSDDGGSHWRAWGGGMPEKSSITDLLLDPQDPSIFYAAVAQDFFSAPPDLSGVYWSRDGGHTFTSLRDGLPGVVQQLLQDPTNPRVFYATTPNDGIYTFTRQ